MSRMNEYVSVTVWKHSDPIDWDNMQAMLTKNLKDQDAPKGMTVRWFEIDENTHGSVLNYPSKEAFENHMYKLEAHIKESSENLGITLDHKHEGVIRAEGSNETSSLYACSQKVHYFLYGHRISSRLSRSFGSKMLLKTT